jgi:tRNA pseudouridine38-40 synthase
MTAGRSRSGKVLEGRGFRMDLKYLGAGYHGWQSQPSGAGIQDHVEKALGTLLRHPVRLIAAARTDSGVHAEHQVTIFRTSVTPDERRWLKGLYGLLPSNIGVTSLVAVADEFHPIYSATGKVYCYRVWRGAARNPFVAPVVTTLHRELNVDLMREAARTFVGRHDFTSFCALDSSAKTRERTVTDIQIVERGPVVEFWVLGEGFLKQMVRNLVGTLLDVGATKTSVKDVKVILEARDRTRAGATAPAEGLSLIEVFYDPMPALKDVIAGRGERIAFKV